MASKERDPFTFSVVRHLGTLMQGGAISKEVNIISFSGKSPVLDIRCWKRKPGEEPLLLRGITIRPEEAEALEKAIKQYNEWLKKQKPGK